MSRGEERKEERKWKMNSHQKAHTRQCFPLPFPTGEDGLAGGMQSWMSISLLWPQMSVLAKWKLVLVSA